MKFMTTPPKKHAKTKAPADRSKDRHKGPRVRLPADLAPLLMELAEKAGHAITKELRLALITYLTARGKWPPPSGAGSST